MSGMHHAYYSFDVDLQSKSIVKYDKLMDYAMVAKQILPPFPLLGAQAPPAAAEGPAQADPFPASTPTSGNAVYLFNFLQNSIDNSALFMPEDLDSLLPNNNTGLIADVVEMAREWYGVSIKKSL